MSGSLYRAGGWRRDPRETAPPASDRWWKKETTTKAQRDYEKNKPMIWVPPQNPDTPL